MSTEAPNLTPPRGYDTWLLVAKNYQKCHRALANALQNLGISVAQHEVLIAIGRAQSLTQQQLAEQLLVVKSNVTGLVQRLEQQGFVQRTTNKEDARSKHLTLTAKGKRMAEKTFALQSELVNSMMGTMTDQQLEKSGQLFMRVGGVLDELLQAHENQ